MAREISVDVEAVKNMVKVEGLDRKQVAERLGITLKLCREVVFAHPELKGIRKPNKEKELVTVVFTNDYASSVTEEGTNTMEETATENVTSTEEVASEETASKATTEVTQEVETTQENPEIEAVAPEKTQEEKTSNGFAWNS